jgi:two-component system sensor histidine kinase ResE
LSFDGSILYANDTAKALWQENDTELQERKTQIANFLQTLSKMIIRLKTLQDFTLGVQVLQVAITPMSEIEGIRGHVAVLRDITAVFAFGKGTP